MSDQNIQLNFGYINGFDSSLFRREDDVLNVFRDTASLHHFDENFNLKLDEDKDNIFVCKKTEETYLDNIQNFSQLKDFESFNDVSDMGTTPWKKIDSCESSEQGRTKSENLSSPSNLANAEDNYSSEFVTKPSKDSFTNFKINLPAGQGSCNPAPVTSLTKIESSNEWVQNTSEIAGSQRKQKKAKVFHRRKDVIIKTLLRKCRKYFLKDFNAKTSYLKTAKRKHGSSVYKTLLEEYINKVFNIKRDDDLLMFLGVFLYQQDLEDNLDQFLGPNFTPAAVKNLLSSVHEILYKYSHQKFNSFSKNQEFALVFRHFDKHGSESLKKDKEYAAGFEIIKDQL